MSDQTIIRATAYATIVVSAIRFLTAIGDLIGGLAILTWGQHQLWYPLFPAGYIWFYAVSLGVLSGLLVRASWQYLGGRLAASKTIIRAQIASILLTAIDWVHGLMWHYQLSPGVRTGHLFVWAGWLMLNTILTLESSLPMVIYAGLTIYIFRQAVIKTK